MKKNYWIAGIVGICVIAALAFGATRIALAQDETPPTTTDSEETADFRHGMLGGRGFHGSQAGSEAVAEALGMTTDELEAALQDGKTLADLAEEKGVEIQALRDATEAAEKTARIEQIEQAVTDGDLTREQADWMIEGIQNGYGMRSGLKLGIAGSGMVKEQVGLTAAAEALGMTVDELSNQLWAGETLSSLAEEKGVELTTVQEAMQAARATEAKTQIEQAVADGTMTQEQADWLLEGIENGYMSEVPFRNDLGRGMGHGLGMMGSGKHGGGRGMGGHHGELGDTDTTQP
jgi:hypothetical protein